MSDLSIELQSTEKPNTFPFKHTSLELIAPNLLNMLPTQKSVGKLTFLLLALNI